MASTMTMPRELLKKWDDLRRAIGVMQTAQPAQMTAASASLEEARNAFEAVLIEASLVLLAQTDADQ